MMTFHELPAPEDARAYVLHGLTRMRSVRLQADVVQDALQWVQWLASEGHPVPPVGFVADVGVVLTGMEHNLRAPNSDSQEWTDEPARGYDDHVLSRLYADRGVDRAADALRRIEPRQRPRAVAFLIDMMRERLGIGGVMLGPASVKPLMDLPAAAAVATAWQAEFPDHLRDIEREQYRELIAAIRLAADLLGPEDIFELEAGTAVAELGQRVALRQIVRAAALFESELPKAPSRRLTRREAPTRMLDDDAYPVGGFASISNRGSLESLLHSQLAYMEAKIERPDLFDVKYLRDDLLYYSRDENQFYRRRRHIVWTFAADMVGARTKDPALPYQRIVLMLAAVVSMTRRLIEWLSDEALTFEFRFPEGGQLQAEQELLTRVLRDEIAKGVVHIGSDRDDRKQRSRGPAAESREVVLSVNEKPTNEKQQSSQVRFVPQRNMDEWLEAVTELLQELAG